MADMTPAPHPPNTGDPGPWGWIREQFLWLREEVKEQRLDVQKIESSLAAIELQLAKLPCESRERRSQDLEQRMAKLVAEAQQARLSSTQWAMIVLALLGTAGASNHQFLLAILRALTGGGAGG